MGSVVEINVGSEKRGELSQVNEVTAIEGKGIEGDRYHLLSDTFDKVRDVSLIEMEAIEALGRDYDIPFSPKESRRNIATRGVPLNHLVGKEFRIGDAVLKGIELCEPCKPLEQLTGKKVYEPLRHRGGLRASVLKTGAIKVGDAISW